MPTKIYWAEVSEHLNYGTEYSTICYCTERPVDVFMYLCRTHEISATPCHPKRNDTAAGRATRPLLHPSREIPGTPRRIG